MLQCHANKLGTSLPSRLVTIWNVRRVQPYCSWTEATSCTVPASLLTLRAALPEKYGEPRGTSGTQQRVRGGVRGAEGRGAGGGGAHGW